MKHIGRDQRVTMAFMSRWTRRSLLLTGVTSWALAEQQEKGVLIASAMRRYSDPSTELEVVRLTDPAHSSWLPAYYSRAISRRGDFLLYASDETGNLQACRLDLRSGEARGLTNASRLDAGSITLLPDEHSFCYFDGPALYHMTLTNLRNRKVYELEEGWQRCAGACLSTDGAYTVIGESRGGGSRLRMIGLQKGAARTVVEESWILSHPQPRPRRAQILYRQEDQELWVANLDGSQKRKLSLADGRVGPARWSPDGRTVLYLNLPDDPKQLHSIRECTPDLNTDKLVARTSQYAHFGCNTNTSVFVGASQNRAAPYILILLRITRRELAVCEHRASDPAMVAPVFSPDSQQIFFESDRHGKPAIYRIRVERLVAETEPESE